MDFVKIATAYVDEGGQLSVGEFCIELGLKLSMLLLTYVVCYLS